jgi:EAL domain-containing protein (putative c-di-GMP-specific phosphodiesterase class I)
LDEAKLQLVPVSINAAPVEFLKDNYAERLLHRLSQYKIPHHLIEIEITEQILDDRGSDYVVRALTLLKQNGVRIALDDFGTGHSSLTRLRDYPVDCLKIDCDFIRRMNHDPAISAIVEVIVALGPKLSLDIVAEGIENIEQLELLKLSGCTIGQGFLFSKAVSHQQATLI